MPLRILSATDHIHVDRLNTVIYAPPGLGKTTLGFTASRPLLLDFDRGAHRVRNRKDIVQVNAWQDIAQLTRDDLADYDTLILDTAGRGLDKLALDIIRRFPKRAAGPGALDLKGFGILKAEFAAWMNLVNSFGKDVVLLAHMDEQRNGDELIERLDVQGGSKGEIYKTADAMGRIAIEDGKRVLKFSPTDTAFGKNPGQFPPLEIPHYDTDPLFLASVIQQIKDKLNELTAAQVTAAQQQQEWRAKVDAAKTVDDFNALLPDAKAAGRAIAAMVAHSAKGRGWTFVDGKAVDPTKPEPKAEAEAPAATEAASA